MQRSRYEHLLTYNSGYVVIETIPPKKKDTDRDYHHCLVMPADGFFKAFGDPVAFADMLEAAGDALCEKWKRQNRSLARSDKKKEVETVFTLDRHTWVERGRLQASEVIMQLSSWGFTGRSHMSEQEDGVMTLRDLKVKREQTFALKASGY